MSQFNELSTPIETRIATGFARICTVMRSQAWGRAVAEGITPTQAEILTLLNTRNVSLRLSVIAEQLAISAATASEAVSTLVSKGLVEKVRAADDGRAVALSLTKKGIKLASNVGEWEGFLVLVLQSLGSEDKVMLLNLIVKIIRAMQERGDIPPTRMCLTCKYYAINKNDSSFPHYCNLVKSPFGDHHVRLDCPEHEDKVTKVVMMKDARPT